MNKKKLNEMTISDLISLCSKVGADSDRVIIKIDNTENSNWICTFEKVKKEEEC